MTRRTATKPAGDFSPPVRTDRICGRSRPSARSWCATVRRHVRPRGPGVLMLRSAKPDIVRANVPAAAAGHTDEDVYDRHAGKSRAMPFDVLPGRQLPRSEVPSR